MFRPVHANLTEDAHRLLTTFCDDEGVSVTGFIEAIAGRLNDPSAYSTWQYDAVRSARKIDTERRSRRPS